MPVSYGHISFQILCKFPDLILAPRLASPSVREYKVIIFIDSTGCFAVGDTRRGELCHFMTHLSYQIVG